MLHDIGEKEYHVEYDPKAVPSREDYLLCYQGDSILVTGDQTLPHVRDLPCADGHLQYLFRISGEAFFTAMVPIAPDSGFAYVPMRAMRTLQPQWLAFAAVTGYHLAFWYQNNRYCGTCGAFLQPKEDERALICPQCGQVRYPNMSVAVIVGIRDGGRILLTRYAHGSYRHYALVAGFVEIGESLEATVRREVMEEVGLRLKNIRYYDNQPWGFSQSMLVGFFADLDGEDCVNLETNELCEAVWVHRDEMPNRADDISLTSKMMEAFRLGTDR